MSYVAFFVCFLPNKECSELNNYLDFMWLYLNEGIYIIAIYICSIHTKTFKVIA